MRRDVTIRHLLVFCILTWSDVSVVGVFNVPGLSQISTDCGGEYEGVNGTILSHEYAHINHTGTRCGWQITVPEGHVVLLRLPDIDLKSRTLCTQYSAYVRDVNIDGGYLAIAACENDVVEPIVSTRNSVWVGFNPLDTIQPNTRFHAEWTAVRVACNPGWILSKFYNRAAMSCVKPVLFGNTVNHKSYDVAANMCAEYRSHLVTITSEQQDDRVTDLIEANKHYFIGLRKNDTNQWNWVTDEAYDYTRLTAASRPWDCATIYISAVFTMQYVAWYQRNCTTTNVIDGYICEHDISDGNQCGGIHTTDSGRILSENYPSTYNTRERCEWKITTSRDKVILLVFTHVDIPYSTNCKSDYIKVRAGTGVNLLLLKVICRDVIPRPFETTVNEAWIEFRSSELSPGTGFQLHWATMTNGNTEYQQKAIINIDYQNVHVHKCEQQLLSAQGIFQNGQCRISCWYQNTQFNNKYVCQQSCTVKEDFDRSHCGFETKADHPCCTMPQCNFTIMPSDTVTETVTERVTETFTSDILTEQDTSDVWTMRDSPHHSQGVDVVVPITVATLATSGVVCGIFIWIFRRRRQGGRKQSRSRRNQNRQNDVPALSPILQTILESEVQLKLQLLLLREDSVRLGVQLGKGAFGIVFKGAYRPDSNQQNLLTVAIKTLSDNCIGSDISAFVDEAVTMAEFNHIHVLSVIGVCINRKTEVPMIVLPFMEHADLKTYLRQSRQCQSVAEPPDAMQLLLFCLHIARGMTYLSGLKFIHRDLAARNCMLDGNMIVKVADFGLSKDVYSQAYYRQEHQKMLPIKWMALESLQDQVYTLYTDIWSYGVTVWEVMSLGKVPYTELDNSMVLEYLETGARLLRPKTCPDFMYTLMASCWNENTDDRPTFTQISNRISDYLSEKCDYLDLNLESGATGHEVIKSLTVEFLQTTYSLD